MIKKRLLGLITGVTVMTIALGIIKENIVYAKGIRVKGYNTAVQKSSYKTAISKEKALQIMKDALKEYFGYNLKEEDFEMNCKLEDGYWDGSHVWSIVFRKDQKEVHYDIAADIESDTGDILYLRNYHGNNFNKAVSKAEAIEDANQFMQKFFPDKEKVSKLVNYKTSFKNDIDNYIFTFGRMENGVFSQDHYIIVEEDRSTGKVISFKKVWNENDKIPDSSKVISQDKSKEVFNNNINFQLEYIPFKGNKTKLVYGTEDIPNYYVDGNTGKFVDLNNYGNLATITKDLSESEKTEWYKKAGEVKNNKKVISSETAKKVIEKYVKQLYGTGYKIAGLKYQNNKGQYYGTGNGVWRADFYKKSKKEIQSSNNYIKIDAINEEIIDTFSDKEKLTSSVKLNYDAAYRKALNLVAKYYPDKVKYIETKQKDTERKDKNTSSYYQFNFLRSVNNIPYTDNGIAICIDKNTGVPVGLSERWNKNNKFTDVTEIKNEGNIEAMVLKHYAPTLTYSSEYNNGELFYKLNNLDDENYYPYVDAFTGKILNDTGKDISK
ncbi:YcdB/YcdC domain-containing protein [Clostridium oryzae]|uniref:Peptidase propeptide and YPEB domain protein n=1 Tax=Clostridium oryzae TaxID=1450648 RepID=A0A1V4IEE6_9CLOT|nr:YcdB/YcdC domain-containing protein [Clostridium oryzae]OPJ58025.1 peptidase propeptide and YPEB domain protein [Clostridium oryzae]